MITIGNTTAQSNRRIESYNNRPIPGILKMTSIITEPARDAGKPIINIVIKGFNELGKI